MLNPKQQKFCNEYASSGNATASYVKVYGVKDTATAQAASSRLLADEKIQKYLRDLSEELQDSTIATRQELQQFATSVVRGEIKSVALDRDGNPIELPAQLKDRLKALELLSRLQGLFVSKQELAISESVPIVIHDDI